MSPTERTLHQLRAAGWLPWVVERWVPGARIRRDLFGILDVVAIRPDATLGVQACVIDDHARRVNKVLRAEHTEAILEAGWHVEVWAWRKLKRVGWQPLITPIAMEDLEIVDYCNRPTPT